MRRLGSALMVLGVVVGVATGLAVLADADIPGVGSWLVAVAVSKLGFIASIALIFGGAVLQRMAARDSFRAIPAPADDPSQPLAGDSRTQLPPGVPGAAPLRRRDPARGTQPGDEHRQ